MDHKSYRTNRYQEKQSGEQARELYRPAQAHVRTREKTLSRRIGQSEGIGTRYGRYRAEILKDATGSYLHGLLVLAPLVLGGAVVVVGRNSRRELELEPGAVPLTHT